jgi:hypothetical protein
MFPSFNICLVQRGSLTKNAIILGLLKAYLGFYVGECPMFQKHGDGPITWLLLGENKDTNCGCTPSLMKRSMNTYE